MGTRNSQQKYCRSYRNDYGAAKEANQSKEEPETVTDEDENKKITASETLKKLDEMKKFVEVNGSDHFNIIINDLIENFDQMKLKNQKQNDIRSFFRF